MGNIYIQQWTDEIQIGWTDLAYENRSSKFQAEQQIDRVSTAHALRSRHKEEKWRISIFYSGPDKVKNWLVTTQT